MSPAVRDNPPAPPRDAPTWLDRLLFYVLLAVLAARPLISESFEPLEIAFLATLPELGGTTPATTAWLDAVLLVAALVILVRRGGVPRSWLPWAGVGLLACGVALSLTAASDRYLALLAGTSLVCGVLAVLALYTQARRPWTRQLVVAALLAAAGPMALKCVLQRTVEYEQMRAHWEQEKKPELLAQGYELDAPLLVNYERRMLSREVSGYLSHANVTGAFLAMWLLVVGGLGVGVVVDWRRRRHDGPPRRGEVDARLLLLLGLGGLGVTLAASLWWTGSLGAQAACLMGVLMLVVCGVLACKLAVRRRAVTAALVAGYLAVIGIATGYGVAKGTLPHPSLAFRWHYWTTAARAWCEVPLTGVGRENFGIAYMRLKPPEGTEEVKNPHNVWVSLLAELGPAGLAGGVLLALACIGGALRNLSPPAWTTANEDASLAQAVPVAVGVLLVHGVFAGVAWRVSGMALIWATEVAGAWLVTFAVALGLLRSLEPGGSGVRWLTAGLLGALVVALVHGLLSFELLTPGGLALFGLVAVAAVGGQTGEYAMSISAWRRVAAPIVAVVGVAAQVWLVALPAQQAARAIQRIEVTVAGLGSRTLPANVVNVTDQAVAATRDAATARIAARALLQAAMVPDTDKDNRAALVRRAQECAAVAVRRNPCDGNTLALRAQVTQVLAELEAAAGSVAAGATWVAAVEDWEAAVAAYPTNPRWRLAAGWAWLEVAEHAPRRDAHERARAHFLAALAIDDTRPPQEVVRLRPRERGPVEDWLHETPPATAPTP